MRAALRHLSAVDRLLFGIAAVCLCGWVVVGIGLYRYGLQGWPIFWGGQLGGVGMVLLIVGIFRVRRRQGPSPKQ